MKHWFRGAKRRPDGTLEMNLHSRVLEDDTTLFIMQVIDKDTEDIPPSPLAELVSFFVLQPRRDMKVAAETLHHVTNQPGVELIRVVFGPKSKSDVDDKGHTCLMLLVSVSILFIVRTEKILPVVLQKARTEFVKRRSSTHTMLQGTGCRVTLVEGQKLIPVYFHGEKLDAGTTVFKGHKGFVSKQIEPFLRMPGVHTRQINDFSVSDLPIVHKVGTHVINPSRPVGFPDLKLGTVLICGAVNKEVLTVLQQLTDSLTSINQPRQIFVIDTYNELNGLINHFQLHPPSNLNLQMFRLGTNIHLNLCDVISPLATSGKKVENKARAAWKAHLISEILLSSLHKPEYLTARYSVPLEGQIKKTAETYSSFTFKNVKLDIGGTTEDEVQVNREGVDMMFADMMAVEALTGILDQLRSFPEINYDAFTGHYSNMLTQKDTLTFFQFGTQPPLIQRATIAFLLHYLSQTMRNGYVVLTHTEELLGKQAPYKPQKEITSSSLSKACNAIARNNVLLLGSQSLQTLASTLDFFDEIQNCIYLKMTNSVDRELIITRHELDLGLDREMNREYKHSARTQQQYLGIQKGEGFLFREDGAQNAPYHFKIESSHLVDLEPVYVLETKQRGSETLGLTPAKYEVLMKLLKLLMYQPRRLDEVIDLVEVGKQGELSLDQFQSLGLYKTELEGGVTYWVITEKGQKYYRKQLDFVSSLPTPLMREEVHHVSDELKRLETFYDISSSYEERRETNTKIKTLVGRLLNYTCQLRTSVPWIRVAEYHDLRMIDALEWQDFRHLFDLAHSMVNNLFLEIRLLQQQRSAEEIQQSLEVSSIPTHPKRKDLDDFLPNATLVRLQEISQELGLEPYPKTGILDLYFALHTQQRSLFDELKVDQDEKKQKSRE